MTCVVPNPPPPPQQPVDDDHGGVSVPWHNWFTREHDYLACIAREGIGSAGATGATGADGSGMVPYFIAATETFTVPLYKQALYAMTIDNEGDLVIDGYLILVD